MEAGSVPEASNAEDLSLTLVHHNLFGCLSVLGGAASAAVGGSDFDEFGLLV